MPELITDTPEQVENALVWEPRMVKGEKGRVPGILLGPFAIIPFKASDGIPWQMLWSTVMDYRIVCVTLQSDAKRIGEFLLAECWDLWQDKDVKVVQWACPKWIKQWIKDIAKVHSWIEPPPVTNRPEE